MKYFRHITLILGLLITLSTGFAMVNHPHSDVVDTIVARDHELPIRFLVFGDNYSVNTVFRQTKDGMNILADSVDFVFNVGDFAAGGARDRYDAYINVLDSINAPTISVLGNHEVNDSTGMDNYLEYFGAPDSFFDFGGYRFIWLMTNHPSEILDMYGENIEYKVTDDQIAWLEGVLSETTNTPILFMHVLPSLPGHIVAGVLGGIGYNPSLAESNSEELTNLIRDYDVRMVFGGHLHNYDRWMSDRPNLGDAIYFITGGAGAGTHAWLYDAPYGGSFHHFLQIQINEDSSVEGWVFRQDSTVLYSDTVYQFSYPPQGIEEENPVINQPVPADMEKRVVAYQKGNTIWVKTGIGVPGEITAEMFDLNGRSIEKRIMRSDIGITKFIFEPEQSGMYLFKVTQGNETVSRKVSYVK